VHSEPRAQERSGVCLAVAEDRRIGPGYFQRCDLAVDMDGQRAMVTWISHNPKADDDGRIARTIGIGCDAGSACFTGNAWLGSGELNPLSLGSGKFFQPLLLQFLQRQAVSSHKRGR
jgi:hypothetical protein